MNIWDAYIQYAWFIAIPHAFFFLTCLGCFVAELSLLEHERKVYRELVHAGFKHLPSKESELVRLTSTIFRMVEKGEVLSSELIRTQLIGSLARYDVLIRFCLNAFVISGLLGTLYNLWKLGPKFWAGLISGQENAGQSAIGIAFSASVIGLGCALLLSFVDSFFIRYRREAFVREAANNLFHRSTHSLPPAERAAIAEALQNFYHASEGFLARHRNDQQELLQEFIKQIRESSNELTKTVTSVGSQWVALVDNATRSVDHLGRRLESVFNGLADATTKTSQTLAAALPRLQEAENLNQTLLEIRSQANLVQKRITDQLDEFSRQWQEDLKALIKVFTEEMERTYAAGWSGYDQKSQHWSEQTAETLNRFAKGIENSLTQSSDERRHASKQVDALISAWRVELGRSTTGVSSGLATLHDQVEALKKISGQLVLSYDTAFQQLRALQSSVATFSQSVLNGTPLGEAINNLNATIAEFKVIPGRDDDQLAQTGALQSILQELKSLPTHLSRAMERTHSEPSPPRLSRTHSDVGVSAGKEALSLAKKPSIWRRVARFFKKDEAA